MSLADKNFHSKAALEQEQKQVTTLFAGLRGSLELLANRDLEAARPSLDSALEQIMEALHRYKAAMPEEYGSLPGPSRP